MSVYESNNIKFCLFNHLPYKRLDPHPFALYKIKNNKLLPILILII